MGIATAVARAFRSLQKVGGMDVVYRAGDQSVPLVAVPGNRLQNRANRQAVSVLSESADWKFLASELAIDGTPVVPKRGHRIEVAGTTAAYEVLPVEDRCFRHDQYLVVIRVHTKQVQE